jgi:hypothetical protein
MTDDELNHSIGETMAHLLPEGTGFVLMYQTVGGPVITLSTMLPEELIWVFEDTIAQIKEHRFSDPTLHVASRPS